LRCCFGLGRGSRSRGLPLLRPGARRRCYLASWCSRFRGTSIIGGDQLISQRVVTTTKKLDAPSSGMYNGCVGPAGYPELSHDTAVLRSRHIFCHVILQAVSKQ
jgi:hypothetical protein